MRDEEAHSPPPVLVTALYCRRFGTLPRAGGLRDQDARKISQMAGALTTYDAFSGYEQASRPIEWRRSHRAQAEWIDLVTDLLND